MTVELDHNGPLSPENLEQEVNGIFSGVEDKYGISPDSVLEWVAGDWPGAEACIAGVDAAGNPIFTPCSDPNCPSNRIYKDRVVPIDEELKRRGSDDSGSRGGDRGRDDRSRRR